MAAAPNSPRSLVARSCWRRVNTRSSRWRSVRLTEVGNPQGRSVQSTRSRRCPWARWTQRCTVASATPKRSATWRMEAPCRTAWTIARRRWVAAVFCSWQTPQEQVSSHAKPVELTSECLRGGDLRVLALTRLGNIPAFLPVLKKPTGGDRPGGRYLRFWQSLKGRPGGQAGRAKVLKVGGLKKPTRSNSVYTAASPRR